MSNVRSMAAVGVAVLTVTLGVSTAWPIYETWWVLVTAVVALLGGTGVAWWGARRNWQAPRSIIALAAIVAVWSVPAAMPQVLFGAPSGWVRGILSGATGAVLGWKQLLTVSLPVGSYQALLVPLFIVLLVSVWAVVSIGVRPGSGAAWAAVPLCAPVLFGTVWGSAVVSEPWLTPWGAVQAPREIVVWIAAAACAVGWVAWVTGAPRRAARARGRVPGERRARAPRRAVFGAVTVLLALAVGVWWAPMMVQGERSVPRTEVLPATVLQAQPSPLATYRLSKRDVSIDMPLLAVQSNGVLPERLRFAVLDEYDGVEFLVGGEQAQQFTRYPSGRSVPDAVELTVRIGDGYSGVWLPGVGGASVPEFSGDRAAELSDAVFVNRASETAIVVSGGEHSLGVQSADEYRVTVGTALEPELGGGPAAETSLLTPFVMPELQQWVRTQQQPATAAGLTELLQRLRDRGYLSHSLDNEAGVTLWSQRLETAHGSVFVPSVGGHSVARLETLFGQLNAQQRAAGPEASAAQLVAAVGDDEQFAAAAALVARELGFESRVVLGVRLVEGSDGAGRSAPIGVPSCTRECTGASLAAWVEVRGAEAQWVGLDVTPQAVYAPTLLAEGAQLAEFETVVTPRDATTVEPPTTSGEAADTAVSDEAVTSGLVWLWPVLRTGGLLLVALLFLVLPLGCIRWVKCWRTRWRRAAGTPEQGALAAWYEYVDQARDAGVALPAGATRTEIARTVGGPAVRWLAAEVDRAVWSPEGVTAAEVAVMWAVVDAEAASRRAKLTRRGRWRERFSLRSIRPDRVLVTSVQGVRVVATERGRDE